MHGVNDRHMRSAPRVCETTVMPLIKEGLTAPQIAARLGVHPHAIYSWCRDHDVAYKRVKPGRQQKPRLTLDLLRDAQKRGLSINELAAEVGMTRGYISAHAYGSGIFLREMKGTWKHPAPQDILRPPPSEESPPSPAMLRLAEFDSIAARAVARKSGQSTPEKEPDPDEGEED